MGPHLTLMHSYLLIDTQPCALSHEDTCMWIHGHIYIEKIEIKIELVNFNSHSLRHIGHTLFCRQTASKKCQKVFKIG
jgi:hypothetical protein